jgi:predicted lipid-binding transport protein (Tim44 family)
VTRRRGGLHWPELARLARLAARAALVLACLAGLEAIAAARPGGGESFSGGGGHSQGGGGDGGGGAGLIFELVFWLFRLVFLYPAIGLPIVGVIVGYVIYSAHRQQQNKDWDSAPPVVLHDAIELSDVRRLDPAFSQVVFEDFAFRLFSTAHRARHTAEDLATVAPYVSADARAELAARPPVGQPVAQVVVGALRVIGVELPDAPIDPDGRAQRVRVRVEYEANLATADHTRYTVETWRFGRDATVQSKPPGATRTFPCPNCGAPWQASRTTTQVCASCGQAVDNGRFDWVVEHVALSSSDERPPTVTAEVPERGTDLPTYRQPGVDAAWRALTGDDPEVTDAALDARLAMIYRELNAAWANNDLGPVRGLVSDGLYDYLSYWVDAYRQQGLRNALEDMRITRTALARLVRDRYYDAITIRIWATGKDYVIRTRTGALVRGSKHRERPYSEYWTLIRSAGRKGAPRVQPACSHCGAPLQINQSGECEHCGAHVTSGEFDWVVSKIEQDDTYRG